MKLKSLVMAVMVLGFLLPVQSAERETLTFYVQLVRGSDSETPPVAGAKRIGPKLANTFGSVFRWKSYWEIASREVQVKQGQRVQVKLTDERGVEIDLREPGKRTISALRNGEITVKTTSPTGEAMTVTGGDRDHQSAWFIVVRRDKPQVEP